MFFQKSHFEVKIDSGCDFDANLAPCWKDFGRPGGPLGALLGPLGGLLGPLEASQGVMEPSCGIRGPTIEAS